MKNVERFIRYAKIDTQSNDKTGTTPSTEKQKNLSRLLVQELKELGLEGLPNINYIHAMKQAVGMEK